MQTKDIVIAQAGLAQFHKQFALLNERAARYEAPALEVEELEHFTQRLYSDGQVFAVPAVRLRITGAPIAKGPWRLVATLDETGGARRLKLHSMVEVPDEYLTEPMTCEHCRVRRKRKKAYLVMHQVDGFLERVGQHCLADYTGISLGQAGWGLTLLAYLERMTERAQKELARRARPIAPHYPLEQAFAWAFKLLREYEETQAQTRTGDIEPRTARVRVPFGMRETLARQLRDKDIESLIPPTRADEARAAYVLAQVSAAFDPQERAPSDFQARVRSILATGEVRENELGLLLWLALRYGQERTTAPSRHVGEEGQRLELRVVVERIATMGYSGYGGVLEAVTLRDASDNVFVWKTSRRPDSVQEGVTLCVRATVKAHTYWKEQAQTELLRVSVQPAPAQASPAESGASPQDTVLARAA